MKKKSKLEPRQFLYFPLIDGKFIWDSNKKAPRMYYTLEMLQKYCVWKYNSVCVYELKSENIEG